ncbi:MAG: tRNA (guanosine(37)-N1)-methyltransferase TrmD [Spirochaetales bacterium]
MKLTVLALFPELLEAYFSSSIMARAVSKGLIEYELVNIRDYATDRHRTCDDAPYGGGYGMVLKPEPLAAALDAVSARRKHVVYASPAGRLFDQGVARELAQKDDLVFICGRYEGIDQRIIDRYVHDEISVGDYVLSSGEVATLTMIDAAYRLIDGVIASGSLVEESHEDFLLEYPHYTRPEVFQGQAVPEILRSGNHAAIQAWRRKKRVERTATVRPDLISRASLSDIEREYVAEVVGGQDGSDKGD